MDLQDPEPLTGITFGQNLRLRITMLLGEGSATFLLDFHIWPRLYVTLKIFLRSVPVPRLMRTSDD